MTVTNGIKTNGKIKSKNQLRRMKAKAKKAEEKTVKVRTTRLAHGRAFLILRIRRRVSMGTWTKT